MERREAAVAMQSEWRVAGEFRDVFRDFADSMALHALQLEYLRLQTTINWNVLITLLRYLHALCLRSHYARQYRSRGRGSQWPHLRPSTLEIR